MGKQKGIIHVSGKVGDVVGTGGKYGNLVRVKPTFTDEQKKAKAALPQLTKTLGSNGIASSINKAVAHYADALKPGNYFQQLHAKFAKESSAERTLKLRRLWRTELNEDYSFAKAGLGIKANVEPGKKEYTVNAEVSVPHKRYRGNNTFSLEFILMVFTKGTDECRHSVQYSSWIKLAEGKNKYLTFQFPRQAGDTDYLLACRAVFAVNGIDDGYWSSAVMRFLTGNAVTKKGLKLLADAEAAKKTPKPVQEPSAEKLRVEARDEPV